MRREKGITLVALVVTIIVLIILAGVSINLVLGDNGIITKAKQAVENTELAQIKEEIELVILEMELEKITGTTQDILNLLLQKLLNKYEGINIELDGDTLTGVYKEYGFTIDKNLNLVLDKEKIYNLSNMNVDLEKEVIEYLGKNVNNKNSVIIQIILQSDRTMDSIEIENIDGSIKTENIGAATYTKNIEIELDKTHRITIFDEEGKKVIKRITEYSIEEISNVSEFVLLRDNVNKGLTYEGKTINLTKDIDLSSVCYRVDGTVENDISWTPIGSEDNGTIFKGDFNGNKNKISNLYINRKGDKVALFGVILNATIKDLNISGNIIINGQYAAGLVVTCGNTRIINCNNYVNITQAGNERGAVSGISTWINNNGIISNCKNYGNIEGTGGYLSGIVTNFQNATVEKCINFATITSTSNTWNIGGIATNIISGLINECINYGDLKGHIVGGILGIIYSGSEGTISNCYNAGKIEGFYSGGICSSVEGKIDIKNSYNYGVIVGETVDGILNSYGNGEVIVNNTYSLDLSCSTITGQTITSEELENLASTLGENLWISDVKENNIWLYNNGYPILKWYLIDNY